MSVKITNQRTVGDAPNFILLILRVFPPSGKAIAAPIVLLLLYTTELIPNWMCSKLANIRYGNELLAPMPSFDPSEKAPDFK
jgi:hypothetical protein